MSDGTIIFLIIIAGVFIKAIITAVIKYKFSDLANRANRNGEDELDRRRRRANLRRERLIDEIGRLPGFQEREPQFRTDVVDQSLKEVVKDFNRLISKRSVELVYASDSMFNLLYESSDADPTPSISNNRFIYETYHQQTEITYSCTIILDEIRTGFSFGFTRADSSEAEVDTIEDLYD